ncbi:PREDICTED: oligoribonuclease, mitochondrial-like isoform X2 [Ceratosolen solmsi marchali]|nr:PREDICTED: oligoribonuclease, mitochondrial-like isoform X2 [Ceratosolen solmsi marchali]
MSCIQNKNNIIWIDMELTGLEIENDCILEIACLVTDENLNIISDEFHKILYQEDSILEKMNGWCKITHSESGLTKASQKSNENEDSVDKSLLNFMMQYVPAKKCPLAGNSIYIDRLFLQKYLKESNNYLHYRNIDVSSIKEVVRRWNPEIYSLAPKKTHSHKAMNDIKETIEELIFYRKNIFNINSN